MKKGRPPTNLFWLLKTLRTRQPDDECWVWPFGKKASGYGMVALEYEKFHAHRIAYAACVGDVPDDLVVRHMCHNPSCFNPRHLALGTQADNMRDKVDRNTHCPNGHEYTPENTRTSMKTGRPTRICRECARASCRRRYHRRSGCGCVVGKNGQMQVAGRGETSARSTDR